MRKGNNDWLLVWVLQGADGVDIVPVFAEGGAAFFGDTEFGVGDAAVETFIDGDESGAFEAIDMRGEVAFGEAEGVA